jgi:hypothetical protein
MNATEAQTRFLSTLMAERVHSFSDVRLADISKSQASAMIEELLASPRLQTVTFEATVGFYVREGQVFRVQKSKNSGNLYAKALVTEEFGRAHWEYAPGVVKSLKDSQRLTLDSARDLGLAHGVCVICGRTLTNPESVDAGIGPICSGKL